MGSEKNFIEKAADVGSMLKQAYELAQKSNDIPLMAKLFEARQSLLLLQEENIEFKKKYEDFKKSVEQNNNLYSEGNFYFEKVSGKVDGPFCTRCWDAEQKKIRLHNPHNDWFECCNCKFSGQKYAKDFSHYPDRAIVD